MGRAAGPTLKLINDIPKVGADRLLIKAVTEPVKYFNGNHPVAPAEERTKFIGISNESVIDAIRMLAGDGLLNGFLDELKQSEGNSQRLGLRETIVRLQDDYFRLTFSAQGGNVHAQFILLHREHVSKWAPLLDQISANFDGGTKLTMGNRYGSAELELSAGQLAKVKAFLLELEQENFAPVNEGTGDSNPANPETTIIEVTPDMWDQVDSIIMGDFTKKPRRWTDIDYAFKVSFTMLPLGTGTISIHKDGSISTGHGIINRSDEAERQGRHLEELLTTHYRSEWDALCKHLVATYLPVK